MPKRKRDEVEEGIAKIEDQALRIRVSRLKARFQNGVQQLTTQLKLARGFDRQKMSRRMKEAGKNKAKVERLETEIQVLKDIQEARVARNHLLKQCVRTKRINEAEAFQALFGGDAKSKIKPPASVAESNVLGRLFKSKSVGDVLPGIMKGIRDVVGADQDRSLQGIAVDTAPVSTSQEKASDEFEGFSDDVPDHGHDEDDSTTDQLEEAYADRLAESSDEDEGEEQDLDPMQITDEEDIKEVSEEDESEKELNAVTDREPETKTRSNIDSVSSTSFLPSLMHGGYYSGSDSEDIDTGYDPDKSFAEAAPQRKNRRGQRERQAIAEKKFGAKAKHLVKANGAEAVHGDRQRLIKTGDRNAGWDPRKGAVDSNRVRAQKPKDVQRGPNRSERRQGLARGAISNRNAAGRANGNTMPLANGEKLHPSWEAARKRKLQNAAAGESAFAGKKITFD